MNRILIVDDNKTLAKAISKRLSKKLDCEIDVAYNLKEAKLYLHKYTYLVTILDINLPDAPNGEAVDYALKHNNKVIVLSGNDNKEFRKKMLEKNILDYVNKTGAENIQYIIHLIKRLQKNKNHKVLVVDDSNLFRKTMQNILNNFLFDVYSVAHGEEALGMLNTHPDISLVITDYYMPVMDGLQLTKEIRKKFTHNDLSIIALSSNDDDEVTSLFLKNGANDYIKKPFSKEEFSCRVNNSVEALENIQYISNNANRDFLTGLYNRRYFYKNVLEYFNDAIKNSEEFSIAMIDIDHFKNVNDTYGHDTGDKVIVSLAELLMSNTGEKDIVSRFGGEEFCVVLKYVSKTDSLNIFEKLRKKVENSYVLSEKEEVIRYTISIGIALEYEKDLESTINQADANLYKAKQNGRNQIVS